jgi:hypothetical protein
MLLVVLPPLLLPLLLLLPPLVMLVLLLLPLQPPLLPRNCIRVRNPSAADSSRSPLAYPVCRFLERGSKRERGGYIQSYIL